MMSATKTAFAETARMGCALLICVAAYLGWLAFVDDFAGMEVRAFPVFESRADAETCGSWRVGQPEDARPDGCIVFKPMDQETAECVGADAHLSGYLVKVRGVEYQRIKHRFYLGTVSGRRRPQMFNLATKGGDFLDTIGPGNDSRPPGVQDWGVWRLRGACGQSFYTSWYTVVYHKPWHGLWNLETTLGPFPLPKR